MVERLILVGFMCSGKSTVGRLVADRLGWDFIDFDETIEREEKKRIADIFREQGEGYFRGLEARLTRQVRERLNVVIAPGGGWVTQPELVDLLRPSSLIVWLRARPETVYQRQRAHSGGERPLLAVHDPLEAIRSILAERSPHYERADAAIDTDDRDPQQVAEEVIAILGS